MLVGNPCTHFDTPRFGDFEPIFATILIRTWKYSVSICLVCLR
jgi:hypothetical protein